MAEVGAVVIDTASDSFLPGVFHIADGRSVRGQRQYTRATWAQLGFLLLAACAGTVPAPESEGIDWFSVLSAAGFFAAGFSKIVIIVMKPDRIWYEGRAAAESVRTLAWRYMVGGAPFPAGGDERETDRNFLDRLGDVGEPLSELVLAPGKGEEITAEMRAMRSQSLAERRAAYDAGRIRNQLEWYTDKADWNRRRAARLSAVTLTAELGLGGVASIMNALYRYEVNIKPVSAAVIGAVVAWMETKQHQNLASAYLVTARELADVRVGLDRAETEQEWARFVDDAEEAMSREHTLWRASRLGTRPELPDPRG